MVEVTNLSFGHSARPKPSPDSFPKRFGPRSAVLIPDRHHPFPDLPACCVGEVGKLLGFFIVAVEVVGETLPLTHQPHRLIQLLDGVAVKEVFDLLDPFVFVGAAGSPRLASGIEDDDLSGLAVAPPSQRGAELVSPAAGEVDRLQVCVEGGGVLRVRDNFQHASLP